MVMYDYNPLAYLYDGAYHCRICTEHRFGRDADRLVVDPNGNLISTLPLDVDWWDNDEVCQVLTCATCNALLDTFHGDDCAEYHGGDRPCTLPGIA